MVYLQQDLTPPIPQQDLTQQDLAVDSFEDDDENHSEEEHDDDDDDDDDDDNESDNDENINHNYDLEYNYAFVQNNHLVWNWMLKCACRSKRSYREKRLLAFSFAQVILAKYWSHLLIQLSEFLAGLMSSPNLRVKNLRIDAQVILPVHLFYNHLVSDSLKIISKIK